MHVLLTYRIALQKSVLSNIRLHEICNSEERMCCTENKLTFVQ